jgi:hypothetical protein
LAGRDPKDVFNKERILNTELDEHLDSDGAEGKSNHRNGYSKKSVLTGTSKMTLSVPRDRAGTFDPKLIVKYQRRFPDFDDKIISMYARGMSVREIRGHLEELYGFDVSPDLISAITDAVLEEVVEWQSRPLKNQAIGTVGSENRLLCTNSRADRPPHTPPSRLKPTSSPANILIALLPSLEESPAEGSPSPESSNLMCGTY